MRQARAGSPRGGRGERWRRWTVGLALLQILAVVCLSLGPLEQVELATQDLRLRACPLPPTTPPIVLVGINPDTYNQFPEAPELFWGHLRAEAIQEAVRLGARVVGLDIIQVRSADEFLDRVKASDAESVVGEGGRPDLRLAEAIQAARKQERHVVLGWGLQSGLRPIPLLARTGADLGFVDRGPDDAGAKSDRPDLAGRDGLRRPTAQVAEPGGVTRHSQLWAGQEGRVLPSFPASIALRMANKNPQDPRDLESLEQPLAGGVWPHSFRIWFRGGSVRTGQSRFTVCRFEDLVKLNLSAEDRLAFRNAAVLIGPLGDVVDVHRGPGGEYDGMEIHAHALATLLEGRPLRRFPLLVEVLLTLGTGLSFHWLKLRTRTSVAVGVLAVLVILGVGHGAAGWAAGLGWMLPQVGPSLALVGVALAHYGVRLVEEKSARDLAEGVLGRQVDLRVATALLGGEAANDLGGVQQEVTVLFTDLRGFTSLADKAEDPQLLFELLSRYLDRMAECVRLEEGTLDKFVGDAVMAFWNAPFGQPDHAARAVRCALQMRDRLAELNTQLEEERRRQPDDPDRPDEVLGRLEFRMGVGINTGVVTVGQLGSRRRMNYTVIGSPVNLAARLESATKELGGPSACEILIGDATYQALNPATRGNQWERQGLQLKGLGATQVAWRYVPLPQEKDSSHAETNRTQ